MLEYFENTQTWDVQFQPSKQTKQTFLKCYEFFFVYLLVSLPLGIRMCTFLKERLHIFGINCFFMQEKSSKKIMSYIQPLDVLCSLSERLCMEQMSLILMKPLNRELFTHGSVWNYGKASDVGCNKIWQPQKYIIKFTHVLVL